MWQSGLVRIIPVIAARLIRSGESDCVFAASSLTASANFLKSPVCGSVVSWNSGVATVALPPAAFTSARTASSPPSSAALLDTLWTSPDTSAV